jgi:hypothetical protein
MQTQAYEGYFENGIFFSSGQTICIPEKTRVVVTLFDEPAKAVDEVDKRLKGFDAIMEAVHAATDEEMPPIESIRFREVESNDICA